MAGGTVVVAGVVKNGIIVPDGDIKLPEGARVEIVLPSADFPPELLAEFRAWDRASEDAWAMMARWEQGDPA